MSKKRIEHYTDYHTDVIELLRKNPDIAQEYLNEALKDEDHRAFLLALKNVIEALGENKTAIARKAKINRENFHRILSRRGNPKISTLNKTLSAIGYSLAVQKIEN